MALLEEARFDAPHLRNMLLIAMNTGMRGRELSELRWPHIDREGSLIRLPAELTKEKKPKSIPINRHVERVLDDALRAVHHGYIISYKGEPIRNKNGPKNTERGP